MAAGRRRLSGWLLRKAPVVVWCSSGAGFVEQFVHGFILVEAASCVAAPLAGMILVVEMGIGVKISRDRVDVDHLVPCFRADATVAHRIPFNWQ